MNITAVAPSVPTYEAPTKTSLKGSEWSGSPATIVELSGNAVARAAKFSSSMATLANQTEAITASHDAANEIKVSPSAASAAQASGLSAGSVGGLV
jgi:hypothetical protein